MHDLSALGFGPFFQQQLTDSASIPARIAAEHRGAYEIWWTERERRAQLAGRLRTRLGEGAFPGVGDWVCLARTPQSGEVAVISEVLSRRTVFMRGAAGRQTRPQVIAANVDFVLAVCGLDEDFNLRRIERYVALIWASGAQPVVVLNKADVCGAVAQRIGEVERRCPGVPVRATSALNGDGLAPIRALIGRGSTAALVGSSGAGKSTLVNALLGEPLMATNEVRGSDGRGRHTTTHRQLILLPDGGLLLDTPGMRELQVPDDSGLVTVFDDVAQLAARCRFRDCSHETEPGCAVKAAIAAGDLPIGRLDHLRKLEREARAYERRHDERLRRESERAWGRLSDEAARSRRRKRGE